MTGTVAVGCLRGLTLLCEAGVVHCDMKADNFMWTKGPDGATVVRIVDFGHLAFTLSFIAFPYISYLKSMFNSINCQFHSIPIWFAWRRLLAAGQPPRERPQLGLR